MATLWQLLSEKYDHIYQQRDVRVDQFPLMNSPIPIALIISSYVLCVKWIGPAIMKNRRPFEMRKILILYNIAQVSINAYLFYRALKLGWGGRYSFICEPVDYSVSSLNQEILEGCYQYLLLKFSEFFDTISFVMRKKFDHVSNLHVIHHAVMPWSVWLGMRFVAGGHATFFGLLNVVVHTIMYSYYLITSLGIAKFKPILKYKKHVTQLQLFQFVLIFLHSFQLVFHKCDFSHFFAWWICLHALMFFLMFLDFYIFSYVIPRDKHNMYPTINGSSYNMSRKYQNGNAILTEAASMNADKGEHQLMSNGFSKAKLNGYSNGITANGHITKATINTHLSSMSETTLRQRQ